MIDFTYPDAARIMRRRRIGLFLRKLGLRPPENIDHAAHEEKIAELHGAIEHGTVERFTSYDSDDWVKENYLGYAEGRITSTQDHTFYPRLFFAQIRDTLKANPQLGTIANFGAFFANVDATLALLHPDRQFLAVDRGEMIATLNRSIFNNQNLTFHGCDIEEVIEKNNVDLLVHCKIATCLYGAVRRAPFALHLGRTGPAKNAGQNRHHAADTGGVTPIY